MVMRPAAQNIIARANKCVCWRSALSAESYISIKERRGGFDHSGVYEAPFLNAAPFRVKILMVFAMSSGSRPMVSGRYHENDVAI